MTTDVLVKTLQDRIRGEVATGIELAPFTSYRIGGPTNIWVAPEDEESVGEALRLVHESDLPLFLLGWGSNVLVADEGWPGVTLYLGKNLSGFEIEGTHAMALSGTWLLDFIRATVAEGLGGMELMAGIPGGVGGALRMNAGAFGQEIESTVKSVRGFDRSGVPFVASREEVSFGYRRAPELDDRVITSAEFEFKREDSQTLIERVEDTLAIRAKKQPLEHPSCGSVFKRPPGYYAGALIEESGFKGKKYGRAMVSDKHAGFILNTGGATAKEVYELITKVIETVNERFGVKLEREVKLVGFEEAGYAIS
ncbi:UDP-N-acetylmuramate dehydrogenase [bacterium]|nr:UDP-N-acetylmuramate dehydrogenase [bacterium]